MNRDYLNKLFIIEDKHFPRTSMEMQRFMWEFYSKPGDSIDKKRQRAYPYVVKWELLYDKYINQDLDIDKGEFFEVLGFEYGMVKNLIDYEAKELCRTNFSFLTLNGQQKKIVYPNLTRIIKERFKAFLNTVVDLKIDLVKGSVYTCEGLMDFDISVLEDAFIQTSLEFTGTSRKEFYNSKKGSAYKDIDATKYFLGQSAFFTEFGEYEDKKIQLGTSSFIKFLILKTDKLTLEGKHLHKRNEEVA